MVLNIIQANKFKRPIYFALTVSRDNQLNMLEYLRMDGLVFKLVSYTKERLSPPKLKVNLFDKFQYRGLNDSTVYFNENIKGLLRNYHGAFFSLAQYYVREKKNDEMAETFDKLLTFIPDSVIPMRDDLSYNMGFLYYQAGKKDKFKELIEKILHKGKSNNEEKLRYASIYTQIFNEHDKAESIARKILETDPNYTEVYYWLLRFYTQNSQYDKGISLLNDWLAKHPDDNNAKEQISKLKELANSSIGKDSTQLDSTR